VKRPQGLKLFGELVNSIVYLVDDDDAVRDALATFLTAQGFEVKSYASGSDFLSECNPSVPGCVLLDLKMPGMGGLSVQEELIAHGIELPIIFMSAYGTVQESVRAMKTGAIDFLEKPFSNPALLDLIRSALARDAEAREKLLAHVRARELFSQLTEREREVSRFVVLGQTSKEIAAQLKISPRTVDHHRTKILLKLQVDSIAELAALVAAELDADDGPVTH
jgi:FixJ family two-component response regulator